MDQPVKHGPEEQKRHELAHQAVDQELRHLGPGQRVSELEPSLGDDGQRACLHPRSCAIATGIQEVILLEPDAAVSAGVAKKVISTVWTTCLGSDEDKVCNNRDFGFSKNSRRLYFAASPSHLL